jgi:hypothetical protein
MRSMVFPACVVAVGLSIAFPAMAADPAPPAGEAKAETIPAGNAPITFEEYRKWRLAAMERRLSEIDMQLGTSDLPAARKARLGETQAYYKWLAGLPQAERDKRFRERFDRIDANHDGAIDPGERAAWREQQRAYYGGAGRGGPRQPASAPQSNGKQPDGKQPDGKQPDGKKDAALPPASAR